MGVGMHSLEAYRICIDKWASLVHLTVVFSCLSLTGDLCILSVMIDALTAR